MVTSTQGRLMAFGSGNEIQITAQNINKILNTITNIWTEKINIRESLSTKTLQNYSAGKIKQDYDEWNIIYKTRATYTQGTKRLKLYKTVQVEA